MKLSAPDKAMVVFLGSAISIALGLIVGGALLVAKADRENPDSRYNLMRRQVEALERAYPRDGGAP